MTIILRSDHYIDTPADIFVCETSTKFRTRLDSVNGAVKAHFPGVYEAGKLLTHHLRQSSVVILSAVNYPHKASLDVAAVCIWAPSMVNIGKKEYLACVDSVISWFWSQKEYESIGMNLVGGRAKCNNHLLSIIQDHLRIWEQYRAGRPDRDLYLHSIESSYLAPISTPAWDGRFTQAAPIWRPLHYRR